MDILVPNSVALVLYAEFLISSAIPTEEQNIKIQVKGNGEKGKADLIEMKMK